MSDAFFYKGLTVECDVTRPTLAIEGHSIAVTSTNGYFHTPMLRDSRDQSLVHLAELVIDRAPEYQRWQQLRTKHFEVLDKGRKAWNDWRRRNPGLRPIVYDAELEGRDLHEFDFSYAELCQARFQSADLRGANFHQAHLGRADLRKAKLMDANFCRADLYETNLSGAFLTGANLQGAQLAKTNLSGAHLIGCKVYGMAAWDLQLDGAEQKDLIVRYRSGADKGRSGAGTEAEIIVDDLQVAQFIYFIAHNPNIRIVLEKINNKGVLILGRFTDERKRVLNAIRERLRELNYLPIIFDFGKPARKDLEQTVKILAGISRFVIGDITTPSSIPLELEAILSNYRIPVMPIILGDEKPFAMFKALQTRFSPCLSNLVRYPSQDVLIRNLEMAVIRPALELERRMEADAKPRPVVDLRD